MSEPSGWIDSHAHLDFEDYSADLDQVLDRAWDAGLEAIVTVGLGRDGTEAACRLAASDRRIKATAGIHPHDARLGMEFPEGEIEPEALAEWQERLEDEMRWFAEACRRPEVVAIGEVGLDYHYMHSPRQLQKILFGRFIDLALELGKPLVIHSREAAVDTLETLEKHGGWRAGGVFHCFPGDEEIERASRREGWYLGISGVVTFRNAERLRGLLRDISLDRLVVETDCPFLAPVPFRGKRNEPGHVVRVGQELARLKGAPEREIARTTTYNAKRLYRF
ncbi:MAG: TatD family deoxyribonuclease [Deltaproteobacteria bacterium]|nr:MAG: TatD family deoxyribonuclease [Deltaproteobacteria bacterium]